VERRRLDGDIRALVSTTLERRGVLAAFTERTGGMSSSPFDSLNLGFRTGDRPERVARNRALVAGALAIPPFTVGRQVHGTRLARVGRARAGAGFADPAGEISGTDGLAVTVPGLPVAILVADCVPVVLASEDRMLAAHIGWRGVAGGILGRAVRSFRATPSAAAIGPAIGPCHYEVGEDVASAVDAGADGGARVERRAGRTFLDLPGTVAGVLRAAGIGAVDRASECTACEEGRFFSHRRDSRTGRQAGVAMRL
jgi:YfiH family protein